MFIKSIITEVKQCVNEIKKAFEPGEKFLAGCNALGGKPVKEISEEIGSMCINRRKR
jgi:hypothetical protein